MVVAQHHGHHPPHVEPLLPAREAAAQHEVVDVLWIELGHLVQRGPDDRGGEVVRPQVDERALEGAADGRTAGGDDDGFGHGMTNLGGWA